jgi:hypothetical protein
MRDSPEPSPEDTPSDDDIESLDLPTETPSPATSRFSTLSETIRNRRLSLPFGSQKRDLGPWKDPQPFEVLRAVENKDLMYLMVRDKCSLGLQSNSACRRFEIEHFT